IGSISSPPRFQKNDLLVRQDRVMDVVTRKERRIPMTTFTIDKENNISAHAAAAEAKRVAEAERFSSVEELQGLAEGWPSARFVEIWNTLPGQTPVKKFTSRKVAVNRLWAAIQSLRPNAGAQAAPVAPEKPRPGKKPSRKPQGATARKGSKTAKVLDLLKRPGGANLA